MIVQPNPQQEEIIRHKDGPCLVAAVPGSGKTTCLTARIKMLLKSNVPPRQILAITFTNKAAKEMKARISTAVGEELSSKMVVCTFHSFCARFLRRHPQEAGLSQNFTIFDSDDQKRLLKTAFCKVLGLDKKSDIVQGEYFAVLGYLEKTRNACLSDGNLKMLSQSFMYRIVNEYYRQLRMSNAVDFTGLLSLTLEILEKHPNILEKYQDRFRYISVDEVQDTNICQYKIIKLLAEKYKNILMTGDGDQSIYRFRGASPENLFKFEQDFGAVVRKLETNYRSTPQILSSAQQLIEKNSFRKDTKLRTDNSPGDAPTIVQADTDEGMAFKIASFVEQRIRRGVPPSEIVILYRIKSATRVLEGALRDRRIPYKIIGGHSFYDRKEVKVCLSILRLMVNGNDRMAFENCIDHCCRGVGTKALQNIAERSSRDECSILDAANKISNVEKKTKQNILIERLLGTLKEATEMPPHEGLNHFAHKTSFWDKMAADKNTEADRCGNINEMCRDVEKYMTDNPKRTLDRYLQDISLISESDESCEDAKISLMTLHACKGLEFDVAIISHVNEGVIPHKNCLAIEDLEQRNKEIEEERRLLYVGMTRARKWLRMAYCDSLFHQEVEPSRFLSEMDVRTIY